MLGEGVYQFRHVAAPDRERLQNPQERNYYTSGSYNNARTTIQTHYE
ncbi:hypothetical protein [Rubritalea tangerina]